MFIDHDLLNVRVRGLLPMGFEGSHSEAITCQPIYVVSS